MLLAVCFGRVSSYKRFVWEFLMVLEMCASVRVEYSMTLAVCKECGNTKGVIDSSKLEAYCEELNDACPRHRKVKFLRFIHNSLVYLHQLLALNCRWLGRVHCFLLKYTILFSKCLLLNITAQ